MPQVYQAAPPASATSESPFRYDIVTTDSDGGPLHIVATTMPTWLNFVDNGDGTAILSGTPTNADAGSHDVVLSLTDGIAPAVEQHFTLAVLAINHADLHQYAAGDVDCCRHDLQLHDHHRRRRR